MNPSAKDTWRIQRLWPLERVWQTESALRRGGRRRRPRGAQKLK